MDWHFFLHARMDRCDGGNYGFCHMTAETHEFGLLWEPEGIFVRKTKFLGWDSNHLPLDNRPNAFTTTPWNAVSLNTESRMNLIMLIGATW